MMTDLKLKAEMVASPEYLKTTVMELAQKYNLVVLDIVIAAVDIPERGIIKQPRQITIKMDGCDYTKRLPLGREQFYRFLDNTFAHHNEDGE